MPADAIAEIRRDLSVVLRDLSDVRQTLARVETTQAHQGRELDRLNADVGGVQTRHHETSKRIAVIDEQLAGDSQVADAPDFSRSVRRRGRVRTHQARTAIVASSAAGGGGLIAVLIERLIALFP